MNVIPFCIVWSNDIHHLKHIKQKTVSVLPSAIIRLMVADETLDFRECFLNRAEIR
jgi:hypothetical protein